MESILPRAVCKINLDNLIHNIEVCKKNIDNNVKFCAIVKADAYGHGGVEVSKNAEDLVDYFAVATPEEALELRNNGIKKPVLTLGYAPKFQIKELIEKDIDILIHDRLSIENVEEVAKKENLKAKVQIKLDTGMSRIGFTKYDYMDELPRIKDNPYFDIRGIFSHFAKGDDEKNSFNDVQYNLYREMVEKLEKIGFNFPIKHLANSPGSLNSRNFFDMVRIGVTIYGYAPFDMCENSRKKVEDIKPVMSLISPVYHIKKVPKGTPIGYGGTYVTEKDEWIATLPIGYSDGIMCSLDGKKYEIEFENGEIGHVVGNICMDQMMVRVDREIPLMTKAYIFTDEKEKRNAEYMAKKANTKVYDIITNIARRVPRWYEKGGKIIKKVSYI